MLSIVCLHFFVSVLPFWQDSIQDRALSHILLFGNKYFIFFIYCSEYLYCEWNCWLKLCPCRYAFYFYHGLVQGSTQKTGIIFFKSFLFSKQPIPFKILSIANHTCVPTVLLLFDTFFYSSLEMADSSSLVFLDLFNNVKSPLLSFYAPFHAWKQEEGAQSQIRQVKSKDQWNHAICSQKLLKRDSCVCLCIVVVEESASWFKWIESFFDRYCFPKS